jgi:hypothetical protein
VMLRSGQPPPPPPSSSSSSSYAHSFPLLPATKTLPLAMVIRGHTQSSAINIQPTVPWAESH